MPEPTQQLDLNTATPEQLAAQFQGKSIAEIAALTGTPVPKAPTGSGPTAEPEPAPDAAPTQTATPAPQPTQAPGTTPSTLKIEAPSTQTDPLAPFVAEFAQHGKLSDQSYTDLAAKGYPKGIVDQYIAGQKALAEARTGKMLSEIGVTDYGALASWAAKNLNQPELKAFNKVMDGGDEDAIRFAISSVNARYLAAQGPNLLQGSRPGSGNTLTPFKSRADMLEAMRDKRYERDPEYRAEVEQRIGISDNI